ncbi:hypothetical protein HK101_008117 [Irineochytrium annulatum]|nr:hypothetical protein HK101_008117 [Irineochytrium annulatum]
MTLLEVCLETVESAIDAEKNGAARVEFCANLTEGGTTPSIAAVKVCKTMIKIPMMVMVRPRGGDFAYTDAEFDIMKHDVVAFKELKVQGVVFGILRSNGTVDLERMKELVDLAKPMDVTFHRAFDVSRDPIEALEAIIRVSGINRILTSGQDSGALEGLETLKAVVAKAAGRIEILPGGGVTPRNVLRILKEINVPAVHMALMKTIDSPMTFRNPNVFMGLPGLPEYSRVVTDGAAVKHVVELIKDK